MHRLSVLTLALGLLFIATVAALFARPTISSVSADGNPFELDRSCRYGASATSSQQQSWLGTIGSGWYIDFGARDFPVFGAPSEYVRMIEVRQVRDEFGNYLPEYLFGPGEDDLIGYAQSYPGTTWVIGNEPDVVDQDDMFPEIYAQVYHEVYNILKTADPTSVVGPAALVQLSPNRMQYFDTLYDSYLAQYGAPIPVDFWNVHVYTLNELNLDGTPGVAGSANGSDPSIGMLAGNLTTEFCQSPTDEYWCYSEHDDLTIFANQIIGFREWMKARGQQSKPLIISEFSVLFPYIVTDNGGGDTSCFLEDEFGECFTPERVSDYLTDTFTYLSAATSESIGFPADNDRLVQQWLWFAMYYSAEGKASSLLIDGFWEHPSGDTAGLTQIGQAYRDFAIANPPVANLTIEQVTAEVVDENLATGELDVLLSAQIRNNGDFDIRYDVDVSFYSDAAMTQLIGSTIVDGGVYGCARRPYEAQFLWEDVPIGTQQYWVDVQSTQPVSEIDVTDNDATGIVVNGEDTYMPIVQR